MVEVDILCVVQDGSVIHTATVLISVCEEHLKDAIELLVIRLQNASQVIKKMLKDAEVDVVNMFASAVAGYILAAEEPLLRVVMAALSSAKESNNKISCLLLQYRGESRRVSIEIPEHLRALRN